MTKTMSETINEKFNNLIVEQNVKWKEFVK